MRITKLEHSGIVIENNGKRIVFDPVEFEQKIPELENVVAIIITHKHSDHFSPEILTKILNDNKEAKIYTTNDTAPLINQTVSLTNQVAIVKAGDSYEIDGFKLDFFGKDHAAIIPGQIPCENIGAVINDTIVNPGDSFDLPNEKPTILFVPASAPWLKTIESMNYIEKAEPKFVIPFHDALLSSIGKTFNSNWLKKSCEKINANYLELNPNETLPELN